MEDRAPLPTSPLAQHIHRAAHRLRAGRPAPGEAKYDPDQPRVPAGNPDGGQWTSGGGRSSAASPGRSRPNRATPQAPAPAGWRRIRREALVDGTGERTLHEAADGTKILTERRTGLVTGAQTSRHIVRMPDGNTLLVDNDRHGVQRIYDTDGTLISAARWGPDGPEPVAVAQQAFDRGGKPKPPGRVVPALQVGIALWNLLKRQAKKGKTPIIVARRRVYAPGGAGELVPQLVGEIDRDEADEYCKRYPEVREKLSDIARRSRFGFKGSAQAFGSLVHNRMKEYVDNQNDRNFRAEVAYDEESPDRTTRRHYKGSTFLDVFERVSQSTVCVYDHKTGRAGLSGARALELATTALEMFPTASRVLMIEVRPGL